MEPKNPRELSQIRQDIDAIDSQLIDLLNRRGELAIEVGKLKDRDGRPFFTPERERQIMESLDGLNHGPLQTKQLASIFREIISAARAADVCVVGSADLFSYPQQATLVKALQSVRPTVLVSLRSPYDILSAPAVAGYVCAYTGRAPSLRALAEVLAGSRAPSGTLPVDVPGVYRIGDGMKKL